MLESMKIRSAPELARALNCSKESVYQKLKKGVITGTLVDGKRWVVSEAEFQRVVAYQKARIAAGYSLPFFPEKRRKRKKRKKKSKKQDR